MILVAKRDGAIVEFHLEKISEAIRKAFKATGKFYTEDIVELLSIRVTSDFQGKMKGDQIAVEDIQDSVEKALERAGYTDVAKAYITFFALPEVEIPISTSPGLPYPYVCWAKIRSPSTSFK